MHFRDTCFLRVLVLQSVGWLVADTRVQVQARVVLAPCCCIRAQAAAGMAARVRADAERVLRDMEADAEAKVRYSSPCWVCVVLSHLCCVNLHMRVLYLPFPA